MTVGYYWREATLDDIDILVRHRRGMFAEMGHLDRLDDVVTASRDWFRRSIAAGVYHAWLAVADADGSIAAGGGLTVLTWPPGPLDLGDRTAYVYNVYTEPAHRRRGLARDLMVWIHDWCRGQGIHSVRLHASDAGRPLYSSMGYLATNEMRVLLTAGSE